MPGSGECTRRPNCNGLKHYLSCHYWFGMTGMTNFIPMKFENDDCPKCEAGEFHTASECTHIEQEENIYG